MPRQFLEHVQLVPSLFPENCVRIPDETQILEHGDSLVRQSRRAIIALFVPELVLVALSFDPLSERSIGRPVAWDTTVSVLALECYKLVVTLHPAQGLTVRDVWNSLPAAAGSTAIAGRNKSM